MAGLLDRLLAEDAMVRLRELLEDRPDAVLSLTAPDLTSLWAAERGAEGVYRRQPTEYEGASTRDFVHPEDLPRWEACIARALAGDSARFDGRALVGHEQWILVRTYLWPTMNRDAVVSITVRVDGDAT